jgi:hypothetical protein
VGAKSLSLEPPIPGSAPELNEHQGRRKIPLPSVDSSKPGLEMRAELAVHAVEIRELRPTGQMAVLALPLTSPETGSRVSLRPQLQSLGTWARGTWASARPADSLALQDSLAPPMKPADARLNLLSRNPCKTL